MRTSSSCSISGKTDAVLSVPRILLTIFLYLNLFVDCGGLALLRKISDDVDAVGFVLLVFLIHRDRKCVPIYGYVFFFFFFLVRRLDKNFTMAFILKSRRQVPLASTIVYFGATRICSEA